VRPAARLGSPSPRTRAGGDSFEDRCRNIVNGDKIDLEAEADSSGSVAKCPVGSLPDELDHVGAMELDVVVIEER